MSKGRDEPWAEAHPPRGEFVLVVAGAPATAPAEDTDIVAALEAELAGGASKRDAAASVALALGVAKRRAYELAVELP